MYNQGYRPPEPVGRRSAARKGRGNTSSSQGSVPPQESYQGNAPYQQQPVYTGQNGYQPTQNWQQASQNGQYATTGQMPYNGYPQQPQSQPNYAQQPMATQSSHRGTGQGYVPTQPTGTVPPRRKSSSNGGGGRPPRRPKKNKAKSILLRAVIFVALAGILIGGAFYGATYLEVHPYDGLYLDQVYVDGIHLGGMTFKEGADTVRQNAANREAAWQVSLTFKGQTYATITSDMLGMQTQTEAILQQASALGASGSIFDQKNVMDTLKATPYTAFTAVPSANNTQVIDDILTQLEAEVYRAPQDAALISYNAYTPNNPFTFQDEVQGRYVDIEPLKEKIYQMVSTMESGDLEVALSYSQPNVTRAQLEQKYTLRAKATTPIASTSAEGRNNNIAVAFDKLNASSVYAPGAEFSFNGIVGWRTQKAGFYEAIEYAYGTETMGWGGGVCQASSTIYIAALTAGLDITERHEHFKQVSYTDFGLDATVSMSDKRKLDLKFKNTTGSNLYIFCTIERNSKNVPRYCTVYIYGEDLGNIKYVPNVETVNTTPRDPATEIMDVDNKYGLAPGKKKKISGRDGQLVQTFVLKYEDNVLVETKAIDTSTIKPKADTIYIGVETYP